MQAKRQGPKKAAEICGDKPDHMGAPKISVSLFSRFPSSTLFPFLYGGLIITAEYSEKG